MVFYGLLLGFTAGVTIPHFVKHDVYFTIANAFLRPHLRFMIEKEKLGKNLAISTELLDSYVKDVFSSFLVFFIVIGPTVYREYIKDEVKEIKEVALNDKYADMLKKIKEKKS